MKTHEYRKTAHCIIYHGKFEPGNQDLKHGALNRLLSCLHQNYGWIIKVPYIIAPGLYVEDDLLHCIYYSWKIRPQISQILFVVV